MLWDPISSNYASGVSQHLNINSFIDIKSINMKVAMSDKETLLSKVEELGATNAKNHAVMVDLEARHQKEAYERETHQAMLKESHEVSPSKSTLFS